MGLLDDAIREHLELKRRHGADPSEVARQEHEALGPVRRGGDGEAPDPDAHLLAEQEERAYEDSVIDAGDDPLEHAALLDDPAAHPSRSLLDDEPTAAPVAEPTPDLREPVAETVETPPAPPEPTPEPPAPTEPDEDPGQETVAFSALEEPEAETTTAPPADDRPRAPAVPPADAGPTEDELAETPDFLQETPEHDRLWFEQKPPRDFDF